MNVRIVPDSNRQPNLEADYVLASLPFNDSDWRGELLKDDQGWGYGTPPAGNANYAAVQHRVHRRAGNSVPLGRVTRGLGVA